MHDYINLCNNKRDPKRRPTLRYKDVLKRDLKAGGISPAGFEALAADRSSWRYITESAIETAEQKREEQWEEKRARRRKRAETDTAPFGWQRLHMQQL